MPTKCITASSDSYQWVRGAQLKKDIAEAICQSNHTLGQHMQQMSMSILQVA